jgi:hypothetical protein
MLSCFLETCPRTGREMSPRVSENVVMFPRACGTPRHFSSPPSLFFFSLFGARFLGNMTTSATPTEAHLQSQDEGSKNV